MYQEQTSMSRTMLGVAIVIAVHVGFILAFKNGLTQSILPLLPKSFQTVFIDIAKPQPQPPVLPKVEIKPPVIEDLPIVDVPIEMPPAETIAVAPPETDPSAETGVGDALTSSELQSDSRYPLTPPEYPAVSRRLNEAGVVQLLVYVLPNGRVGEVRVNRSSGYPRLDESAMREAKRSWRFQPRIVQGQAVASWGTYAVRFRLTD